MESCRRAKDVTILVGRGNEALSIHAKNSQSLGDSARRLLPILCIEAEMIEG